MCACRSTTNIEVSNENRNDTGMYEIGSGFGCASDLSSDDPRGPDFTRKTGLNPLNTLRYRLSFYGLILGLLWITLLEAQTSLVNAALDGTVTDSSGERIPDARYIPKELRRPASVAELEGLVERGPGGNDA